MTPERRAAETALTDRLADTIRKRAERQRRREAGEVRVEVWLRPKAVADLNWLLNNRYQDRADAISEALIWLKHTEDKDQ